MNFIRLTGKDSGEPIYVDPEEISLVARNGDHTGVGLRGKDIGLQVREDVATVLNIMTVGVSNPLRNEVTNS